MRTENTDPLRRVVDVGDADWTRKGRLGMMGAGIFGGLIEKEHFPVLDDGIDIWDDIYEGRLILSEEEAMEEDIKHYHATHSGIWYTDGSVVEGRGAAGVARFSAGETEADPVSVRGIPLSLICDSFTAEQLALQECTANILAVHSPGDEVVVMTDSLSNVMSLHSPAVRDSREDQIMRNLRQIYKSGIRIEIRFVRGHNGCQGNLLADAACSEITKTPHLFCADRVMPEHVVKTYVHASVREFVADNLAMVRDSGNSATAEH